LGTLVGDGLRRVQLGVWRACEDGRVITVLSEYSVDSREAELRSVEIEAIEAAAVGDVKLEGVVPLQVAFRNVRFNAGGGGPGIEASEPSWFAHQLRLRIRDALGLSVIGARRSVLSFTVPRDHLEEAIRTIKSTVATFRDSYSAVLADHERVPQERADREEVRYQRRIADQEVIDRIMNE
jgi:hypothetical protein